MSLIGKNIKKIRTVKKLSQADFSNLFNLARASVGAYEEGRSEPKIETLIQIAHYFSISIDTLLTKELTINELYQFDIFSRTNNERDHDDLEEKTPLVRKESQLEYIVQKDNKDYINNLPSIMIPLPKNKKSRAFINADPLINYHGKGIFIDDIMICNFFDHLKGTFEEGKYYVLVNQDHIACRKFEQCADKKLVFGFPDPELAKEHFQADEILECWELIFNCSGRLQFDGHESLEKRISNLEKQVMNLLNRENLQ